MRIRFLITLVVLLVVPIVTTSVASGSHGTTIGTGFCKWAFYGERTIRYYVYPMLASHFPADMATRVSYGGFSWNAAGLNLQFEPTTNLNIAKNGGDYISYHNDENPSSPTAIADTGITPNTGCSFGQGGVPDSPIVRAYTRWRPSYYFHSDCVGSWCADNGYYDVHNVASHEFGHWFHMGHSGAPGHSTNTDATMHQSIAAGETKKRSLTSDDIAAGALEYGYR